MMRTLIMIGMLVWFFSALRSAFKKRTSLSVQLLISMMFFGGIGFAVGDHYWGSGWAIFGAVFGLLVGIELKEKLFQAVRMIYKDLAEDK